MTNTLQRYGPVVRPQSAWMRSNDVDGCVSEIGRDAVRVWSGDLSEQTFYDRYDDAQLEAFISVSGAAGGDRQ